MTKNKPLWQKLNILMNILFDFFCNLTKAEIKSYHSPYTQTPVPSTLRPATGMHAGRTLNC